MTLEQQLAAMTAERDNAKKAARWESDLAEKAIQDLKTMTTERDGLKDKLKAFEGLTYQMVEIGADELAALRKDAARYQWLSKNLLAADFDYGEEGECVLVFTIPATIRVSVSCDDTIDAAMQAKEHP